jgi:hypothetical protein
MDSVSTGREFQNPAIGTSLSGLGSPADMAEGLPTDDESAIAQLSNLNMLASIKRLKEQYPEPELRSDRRAMVLEIAERLGCTERNVNRYMSVLDTPLIVQELFTTKELTLELACLVASLIPSVQQDVCRRLQAGEDPQRVIRDAAATSHRRRHYTVQQPHGTFLRELRKLSEIIPGMSVKIEGHLFTYEASDLLANSIDRLTALHRRVGAVLPRRRSRGTTRRPAQRQSRNSK